jgi:CRP-like cAMP-binding protein
MKDQKIARIAELALFRDCRPADLQWIARAADMIDLPAGRDVRVAGSTVREFVVLVDGTASMSNGHDDVLLAPGTHVGEREILDRSPAAGTVTARTRVRLLVFGAPQFRGMLDRLPGVGRRILAGTVSELCAQEPRSLRAVS